MAGTDGSAPRKGGLVNWVSFPGKEAALKRLLDTEGNPGLVLRVAEGAAGAEIAKRAVAGGFRTRADGRTLTIVFERGKPPPLKVSQVAEMLGGELSPMPRERLLSSDMTVNLHERATRPVAAERAGKRPAAPNPDNVETIGLNMRGEEVVRDGSRRFLRRSAEDGGRSPYLPEADGERPALHLRALKPEDLDGIAAGLLRMADRGSLRMPDLNRVLDASLEEGPAGRLDMARDEAFEHLRGRMLRQIANAAVGSGGADRADFQKALRLAANTGYAISRRTEPGRALRPGASLLALFRRLSRGSESVDFRGDPDLALALPRVPARDAALQVHDLAGIAPDGVSDYAMNALSRRPADGSSVFIAPSELPQETFERLRSDLGLAYGLEVVAEIASAVADGAPDGRSFGAIFVGERRPEALGGLPRAALRSFAVASDDDLIALEREIARSRTRIRDFNLGEVETVAPEGEDGREENARQRPYRPLSRAGEPFSMIPRALEGATSRALDRVARDAEPHGGVDALVARALGRSVADLGEILTPEQVDAVGMRMNAAERGRGFLVADQTGVGKGRAMAAMVRAHLRANPANRCIYATESAAINVPDVLRDLNAVEGFKEARPFLLTSGSEFARETFDPASGGETESVIRSPGQGRRREIYASGEWPGDDVNLIVTTYSQFNVKEDAPAAEWLAAVAGERTLLVLDESHNALNPRSNTGRNFRAAQARTPARNVVYATATPARNPQGMDLYRPLLPQVAAADLGDILDNIASGGEVAQEAFATMLAEDGAMVRRDHDLSATEYRVHLPEDARILEYQEAMNRFSPVVEGMIDVSTRIGEIVGRAQAIRFRRLVDGGMDERRARFMTNELSQYSLAIGGPLAIMARAMMNAIKVDQVVEAAIGEIEQGRKPLITFHSTGAALLEEAGRGPDGRRLDDEALARLPELTIRDQIRRIHESLYRMRVDGESRDPRDEHEDVREAFERVEALIDAVPDLPASPVDAVIERLEANDVRTGEISGRALCYRRGRIRRRTGLDRRETIDRFNAGEIDAMLYNSAGATGGSYHASPDFADRRPRTLVEFEAPIDIIKYVQAQGRGNRYGQVASPRVLSVMTGLTPEMRILQQRNGKLRSLGASVDGNRAHPLLLDDVPDLLNRVGDEATLNVLLAAPGLARRLGFPRLAEEEAVPAADVVADRGSGAGRPGLESLANKALARSIMLSAREQEDLVQRIRMEFDALVEELESRNANPLRPKEFGGVVDIRTTTIFSGQELEDDELDISAFLSPVYMSTAEHDLGEDPVAADRLATMVERAVSMHGSEGMGPYAARIGQNLHDLLRPFLPPGFDMETALADPGVVPGRFAREHARLTDLAWILENLRPGVAARFPSSADPDGTRTRTVIDLIPPKDQSHYVMPSAYRVRTVCPGDSAPETIAVSRIMSSGAEAIRFGSGISEGFDEAYMREFARAAKLRRLMPVQILGGNILQAITIANRNGLGTVSLYRDAGGVVHRGIVVHDSRIDMRMLPVPLPDAGLAAEAAARFVGEGGDAPSRMLIWGSMDPESREPGPRNLADIIVRLTARTAKIDMKPLRTSTRDFYLARPGLHEALHGSPIPETVPERAFRRPGTNHKHLVEFAVDSQDGRDRLRAILERLRDVPMMTDGVHRDLVNAIAEEFNRAGAQRAGSEAGSSVSAPSSPAARRELAPEPAAAPAEAVP